MRFDINYSVPILCIIPIVALMACAWYLFHDAPLHLETTPRARAHIELQLKNIPPSINPAQIQEAFAYLKNDPVILVQIAKHHVKIATHHEGIEKITYYKAIEETLKKYAHKLKDNIFIWNLSDTPHEAKLPTHLHHIPIFVFSLDTSTPYHFQPLMNVDSFTLKKWPRLYDLISRNRIPFDQQQPIVFWRGKSSDVLHNQEMTPRRQLVEMSLKYPDRINARFTKVFSKNDAATPYMKTIYQECSMVSEADHLKYRYQIVLDGVTATFPGFLWRLASGCLTLKTKSPHKQWFYDWVKPYEHYVPISHHFDLLLAHLEDDKSFATIAQNARKLVEDELTPSKVMGYFIGMLNAYSKHIELK